MQFDLIIIILYSANFSHELRYKLQKEKFTWISSSVWFVAINADKTELRKGFVS